MRRVSSQILPFGGVPPPIHIMRHLLTLSTPCPGHISLVNQTVAHFSSLRMRGEERKEKYVWPNTRFRLECDDVITLLRNSRDSAI